MSSRSGCHRGTNLFYRGTGSQSIIHVFLRANLLWFWDLPVAPEQKFVYCVRGHREGATWRDMEVDCRLRNPQRSTSSAWWNWQQRQRSGFLREDVVHI